MVPDSDPVPRVEGADPDPDRARRLGAGLRGEMNNSFGYRFDYAFADMGRLEETHRITLGLEF